MPPGLQAYKMNSCIRFLNVLDTAKVIKCNIRKIILSIQDFPIFRNFNCFLYTMCFSLFYVLQETFSWHYNPVDLKTLQLHFFKALSSVLIKKHISLTKKRLIRTSRFLLYKIPNSRKLFFVELDIKLNKDVFSNHFGWY